MSRAIYRSLLWLHPAAFRDRFAAEMLWLYDETVGSEGAAALLADGFASLVRQWLTRRLTWKVAAAVIGGMLEVGLVLALSRGGYSDRARAANRVSETATSIDSDGLATDRTALPSGVANSRMETNAANPQAAPARGLPVSALPVGDAPLGFAVLFGIVFVYACRRRGFQLGVRSTSPARRRLRRDQIREMPRVEAESRLSTIAD